MRYTKIFKKKYKIGRYYRDGDTFLLITDYDRRNVYFRKLTWAEFSEVESMNMNDFEKKYNTVPVTDKDCISKLDRLK